MEKGEGIKKKKKIGSKVFTNSSMLVRISIMRGLYGIKCQHFLHSTEDAGRKKTWFETNPKSIFVLSVVFGFVFN